MENLEMENQPVEMLELEELEHTPRKPKSCPVGFRGQYTVKTGDSIWSIAKEYHITEKELAQANPHIPNPNVLYVGDVLCVPGKQDPRRPKSCPVGFKAQYTVKAGDSMWSIAKAFGVSVSELAKANPQIPSPNVLHIGDVLCVPGKC